MVKSRRKKQEKKYKFYTNKRTGGHPAIDLGVNKDGKWETIDITSNVPGYDYFDKNPNIFEKDKKKISFFRKYISKNETKHKGEYLRDYDLSPTDEKKIDQLVKRLKNPVIKNNFHKKKK